MERQECSLSLPWGDRILHKTCFVGDLLGRQRDLAAEI